MAKSKVFILERGDKDYKEWTYLIALNGVDLRHFCKRPFRRFFGIKLKPGERKKIEITIKEVK